MRVSVEKKENFPGYNVVGSAQTIVDCLRFAGRKVDGVTLPIEGRRDLTEIEVGMLATNQDVFVAFAKGTAATAYTDHLYSSSRIRRAFMDAHLLSRNPGIKVTGPPRKPEHFAVGVYNNEQQGYIGFGRITSDRAPYDNYGTFLLPHPSTPIFVNPTNDRTVASFRELAQSLETAEILTADAIRENDTHLARAQAMAYFFRPTP